MLTNIINGSFQSGVFPEICKTAVVKPLIKKCGLDRNILKNYRPVSNCSFLDKLLEKCAYMQINKYLYRNKLYGKYQSAYRSAHSTETALLRVQNDVLLALDKKKDVILVLLDLSAAFDTIDHDILLQRLEKRFGIGGLVLDWLRTFLCGRTQRIMVGSMVSEARELKFGVPQGSVLGPILFSLYVTPLEEIITSHGCETMIFADDTQLYITCDSADSVTNIQSCIDQIRHWMCANFLSLNDSKTEVVCFSSKFNRNEPFVSNIKIGECVIDTSSVVRNLGVMFDANASMSHHVSNTCKAATYSLWRISRIRHLLDKTSTERLIHAFVSSRLDYSNSLLYGIQDYQLKKFQVIQNSAARLVAQVRRSDNIHTSDLLQSLHWLPVALRVQFKLICIVFKCLYWDSAPTYLKDLLTVKTQGAYDLRSDSAITLVRPSLRTLKSYGDRSFYISAPVLWNNLPQAIRSQNNYDSFKSKLKTHLFRSYYNV